MAYVTPADLLSDTWSEYASGVQLDQPPSNGQMVAAIARFSQRIDELTHDHFETTGSVALDHSIFSANQSRFLYLNKRCTTVTAVNTRDHFGNLTLQSASSYRLKSSLDTAGANKIGELDYLEILPWGNGIVGPDILWGGWVWPQGTNTVQVTGTFGWTVTPGDIKRAVALLVWDHFANQRGDLQRAAEFSDQNRRIVFDRGPDSWTGIPEADAILKRYEWHRMAGVA
jgi:hypothetical protein